MVNDVLSQKQSNQLGLTPAIGASPNFSKAQKSLADSNNNKFCKTIESNGAMVPEFAKHRNSGMAKKNLESLNDIPGFLFLL